MYHKIRNWLYNIHSYSYHVHVYKINGSEESHSYKFSFHWTITISTGNNYSPPPFLDVKHIKTGWHFNCVGNRFVIKIGSGVECFEKWFGVRIPHRARDVWKKGFPHCAIHKYGCRRVGDVYNGVESPKWNSKNTAYIHC